ncbi:hypothetical protein OG413_45070 [Streptomyces sp. NBC_01433]|uniref:hypothetical protein n=1 Tax=Streptomyces sp. NBC_01433 TaxID=2903864 RepID=UPI0022537B36|nr:hypothetical protein [Streptomyces sp. NBC_01433]MCX4682359.1 hypothetical protein [Streptomyces sp. NBC_01433]
MGRIKAGKPRRLHPGSQSEPPYIALSLDGPALALAWDENGDQALTGHSDKLVIVAPSQEQARVLWSDLAAETPRVGTRDLMVSDADQWRGSRSDHPDAFLACLRYQDDSTAGEDIVRYRSFIRSMGLEPVI